MSIRRVVSNVDVFRTWVDVLSCPFVLFKPTPFVLSFGMRCGEHKLFFGLLICIDVISDPCLEMTTGLLTIQLLLSYC